MRNIFVLFSLIICLAIAANAQNPVPVQFDRGASEKTLTVTVKADGMNKYSISVRKDQVINLSIEGDINISNKVDFPVIALNLANGQESLDNWQDGEGYLSILAGRNGKYIVFVSNSDKKRARTFKLTFKVTDDKDDYMGGVSVD